MAKVELADPIKSISGILVSSDPYYFRRFPVGNGEYMCIAQKRPNRKSHIASPEELAARLAFGVAYGKQKRRDYLDRKYQNIPEIQFPD